MKTIPSNGRGGPSRDQCSESSASTHHHSRGFASFAVPFHFQVFARHQLPATSYFHPPSTCRLTLTSLPSIAVKHMVPNRDSGNFHHRLARIRHFVADHQSFGLSLISSIKRAQNGFICWPDFNRGDNFASIID